MKLHTCLKCGGPRRSLTQELCAKCRKHPKDICPRCGGPKMVETSICIKCHAKEAILLRWSKPHFRQSRYDSCPGCGQPKMKEAKLCQKCSGKRIGIILRNKPRQSIIYDSEGHALIKLEGQSRKSRARIIMESILKVPIPKGYDIHHQNLIPDDDRPQNLVLLKHGTHTKLHNDLRK
jgi:hypothetical protein